jgi:ElaB/YqjD/DUF883 family membrane-anchored ribosome-binding protein
MAAETADDLAVEITTLKSDVENVRKDFDALVATVAQDASGSSRDSLDALKQGVVERPITSLIAACCVGILIGRMIVR